MRGKNQVVTVRYIVSSIELFSRMPNCEETIFYGAKKVTPLTRKGKRVKKVKKKIGIF